MGSDNDEEKRGRLQNKGAVVTQLGPKGDGVCS